MEDTTSLEVQTSERLTKERTVEVALGWHDEFEETVWKPYAKEKFGIDDAPSFHNRRHIEALLTAHEVYFQNLRAEGADPLNIKDAIATHNSEAQNQLSLDEYEETVAIAIAFHDVGNIIETVDGDDGQIKPQFRKSYTAKGAEEVSEEIAMKVMDVMEGDDVTKEDRKGIVRSAIQGTVFDFGKRKADPLQNYMEVLDQIGNDFVNTDETRQVGLVLEMENENPGGTYNPSFFLNFGLRRMSTLVPDVTHQKELLKIFNKSGEGETSYPDEQLSKDEFVAQYSKS